MYRDTKTWSIKNHTYILDDTVAESARLNSEKNGKAVYRVKINNDATKKRYVLTEYTDTEEHDALLKLSGISDEDKKHFVSLIWSGTEPARLSLFEFCDGGNLSDVYSMRDAEKIEVINTIVRAVSILHENDLCHGDIKPDNIYRCNGHVKIGDLEHLFEGTIKQNRIMGTPQYKYLSKARMKDYRFKDEILALIATIYRVHTGKTLINKTFWDEKNADASLDNASVEQAVDKHIGHKIDQLPHDSVQQMLQFLFAQNREMPAGTEPEGAFVAFTPEQRSLCKRALGILHAGSANAAEETSRPHHSTDGNDLVNDETVQQIAAPQISETETVSSNTNDKPGWKINDLKAVLILASLAVIGGIGYKLSAPAPLKEIYTLENIACTDAKFIDNSTIKVYFSDTENTTVPTFYRITFSDDGDLLPDKLGQQPHNNQMESDRANGFTISCENHHVVLRQIRHSTL